MPVLPPPGNTAPDAEEPQHAQVGTDAGTAVEPPQTQRYAVEDDEEDIRHTELCEKDAPLQPADVATDGTTSMHEATPDVRFM